MNPRLRLTILGLLLAVVVVTVSLQSDPDLEPTLIRRLALETSAWLHKPLVASARGVENFWTNYFYLVGLREENRRLKRALGRMRTQVNELREDSLANDRLSRMLRLTESQQALRLGARVVSWDPGPWFKTVVIDRGSSDGVRSGMPVLSDLGVIGRTVEVTPHFSKVLLIIDYNSRVDALVQRNRVRGILAGRSEKTCRLNYVLKNDDVQREDVLVTAGTGGIYPRGLPLGRVNRVRKEGQDIFLEIDVTPAADFDRLEEVVVLLTRAVPF